MGPDPKQSVCSIDPPDTVPRSSAVISQIFLRSAIGDVVVAMHHARRHYSQRSRSKHSRIECKLENNWEIKDK